MSEYTKSAMTEAEWAQYQIDVIDPDAVQVRIPSFTHRTVGGIEHKVAAACLYEQPFGFTHEDVELLESVDLDPRLPSDERAWLDDALRDLADRIEALLPPRSEAHTNTHNQRTAESARTP